jgi:hypothetical protein
LGYEGTWLADDTLASNALYVYKELNKRGYDKSIISQRVAQLKEFQEQIEERIKSFKYGKDSLKEGYEFPKEYDYGRHLEATRGDKSRFLGQIESELESQKNIGQKYEGRNLRNKPRNRTKQKINR